MLPADADPSKSLPESVSAVAEAFAKLAVPVKVGDAEKTALPVPVSSVRMPRSFADVSTEVVARLPALIVPPTNDKYAPAVSALCFPLNALQSAEVRRPSTCDADAIGMFKVCVEPEDDQPQPPLFELVANVCAAAVRPFSDERNASVDVEVQSVVDPFEVRNCPFIPAEPVLSKSFRTVRNVVVAKVVDAFVTTSVSTLKVPAREPFPETRREGVERRPAVEMVVDAD